MKFKGPGLTPIRNLSVVMIAILIILTVITVCLYPENLNKFGRPAFVWSVGLLLAYLVFSFFIPALGRREAFAVALRDGTAMGFITGAIWMVHVTLEYFVALPQSINGAVTLGFMAVLFIGFGVSAYITMKKTNRAAAALLSGVWCAMLSILILFVYGFLLNFIFMQRLITILQFDEEFKMSRMPAAPYTFHNTLESGGTHLLLAPVIAVVFSLMAVGVFRISARMVRRS